MKNLIRKHREKISHVLWYGLMVSVFMFAPIGIKSIYPPALEVATTFAEDQECNYKVSRAGNIYLPDSQYYGMTTHETNLCKDQAEKISARIKITIED